MYHNKTIINRICTIEVINNLSSNEIKDFNELIQSNEFDTLIIDLKDVKLLISTGLGVLLTIREETVNNNVELQLISPRSPVRKSFELSRFYDLFNIQN